jgi:hypothetical protein
LNFFSADVDVAIVSVCTQTIVTVAILHARMVFKTLEAETLFIHRAANAALTAQTGGVIAILGKAHIVV